MLMISFPTFMCLISYLQEYGAIALVPLLLAYFMVGERCKQVGRAILCFTVFDLLMLGLLYAKAPLPAVVTVGGIGVFLFMVGAYMGAYRKFGLKNTLLYFVLIPLLTVGALLESLPWGCRILCMATWGVAMLCIVWFTIKKHGVMSCLSCLPFLLIALPLLLLTDIIDHWALLYFMMALCCLLSNYIDSKIKKDSDM